MKPKYKTGDLVRYASLQNAPILFILGFEEETESHYAQYIYYNLQYPENISRNEQTLLESYYMKVNR